MPKSESYNLSGSIFSKLFRSKHTESLNETPLPSQITAESPIPVAEKLQNISSFQKRELLDEISGGKPRPIWLSVKESLPEDVAEKIENEQGFFNVDLGTLKVLSARKSKKVLKDEIDKKEQSRFELKTSYVNSM